MAVWYCEELTNLLKNNKMTFVAKEPVQNKFVGSAHASPPNSGGLPALVERSMLDEAQAASDSLVEAHACAWNMSRRVDQMLLQQQRPLNSQMASGKEC